MNYINLKELGFTEGFVLEADKYKDMYPARVSEQHRNLYKVFCEHGELLARVSGKLSYNAYDNTGFPAVGDWVMIDRIDNISGDAVIHHILKRKSVFERKAAGTSNQVQIVAANIDVVFICMSLNNDFNLRRLERYLAIAWNSMAAPVILLTKSDLCDNLDRHLTAIFSVAVGTDVLVTSSVSHEGYREIEKYIDKGKTIAFIGSSGVGKSTLINRLLGKNLLATGDIRDDDRGRHTTTYRQLIILPNGGIVIDTPGMRELQLESADLSRSFEDIEELALQCRFKNCTHRKEPHCAVREAIANGSLSEERFESYKKLQKELSYQGLESRQLEQEKIKHMFGGMSEMKQAMKQIKNKNRNFK